ncbi:helix-loop-helix domain-containing protein [Endozoicomonas sp. GU-1]|uniref:basic helix-loop-helix domain-containing protein n=1 Tax=Endozoicomonas sp. GU-1 TaxID=3009078 RepID=UPI0022B47B1C|nr:helix-loop-helix domain-containing protein [Endozoicomonas sp. GU-1]WBA81997.1 helix-loop-helix domain-containing protein [Endozoicomonas sp. GU-1]WBA84945.1 helix-loop-helix domain-containing protein [Endozoicomonas sp. GU-1]
MACVKSILPQDALSISLMSSKLTLNSNTPYQPQRKVQIPPQRSYVERKKIRADNEKRRRATINQAYQALRNEIPGAANQKLTKIETLIQATAYIQQLEEQLEG